MAFADLATEGEGFIDTGRGEPADANVVVCRMVIREEIVLAADTDGGPVAEGILLRFVDFVLGEGPDFSFLDPVLGDILRSRLSWLFPSNLSLHRLHGQLLKGGVLG